MEGCTCLSEDLGQRRNEKGREETTVSEDTRVG